MRNHLTDTIPTGQAASKHPPAPDPLAAAVDDTIAAHGLLPGNSAVVVAVSGGADSMALIDIIRQLAPAHQWRLHVAHVNHRLRGAESDADAEFVARWAEDVGLPCTVRAIDVGAAQQRHASPENVARRLRYRQLAGIAQREGSPFIALAHHEDDQAETVLLHLLRGSGLAGLSGMRRASPLGSGAASDGSAQAADRADEVGPGTKGRSGSGITLVRPLLDVSRAELRAYCARRGVPFREDSTNETTAPQRNWLRHTVMPLLETRYPAAARTLARAAHVLADDHEFLAAAAEEWLDLHTRRSAGGLLLAGDEWRALPAALQAAALRAAIYRVAGHVQGVEFAHVAAARDALRQGTTGASSPFPGGLICRAEQDGIWLGRSPSPVAFAPVALAVPGGADLPALACSIHATLAAREGRDAVDLWQESAPGEAWLDAERTPVPLRVRTRLPGDRFMPLGMTGVKKLQDFLVDARVPARLRDRTPLVVTAEDAIVWVAGHRIDARYRITDQTRRLLRLRLEPAAEDRP